MNLAPPLLTGLPFTSPCFIHWCPYSSGIIAGMRTLDHLNENVDVSDG
jgi:hypothetical protein